MFEVQSETNWPVDKGSHGGNDGVFGTVPGVD